MTGILTDQGKAEREAHVKAVVGRLAHEVPELADLDGATLEKIARLSMIDEVKGKLRSAAELERIDYQGERGAVHRQGEPHRVGANEEAVRFRPGTP
jgi:hypothetical protein